MAVISIISDHTELIVSIVISRLCLTIPVGKLYPAFFLFLYMLHLNHDPKVVFQNNTICNTGIICSISNAI